MTQALSWLAEHIATQLGVSSGQVARTVALLDDQNTIPFIARYRKEVTGGLDEVQIAAVARLAEEVRALEARRADVARLIQEHGKLTLELSEQIATAQTVQALDDLYLPFRPKRRTRAMIARERGLEPLALSILDQAHEPRDDLARPFVDADGDVPTVGDAVAGARDIVAELIAEDAEVRGQLRALLTAAGEVSVGVADAGKDSAGTYAQYYEFKGRLATLPPHRILALNRGEREGVLKVEVAAPEQAALGAISHWYPADTRSPLAGDLRDAVVDSYRRLLGPSLEREARAELTARAEVHAINVFSANLRPLLLQPPLRGQTVMGIDPGYRTGCKVAVVDETGKLLACVTIYPHPPQKRWDEAKATLRTLARTHSASVFAVGNGTASRESEELVAELIGELGGGLRYMVVDEAGASVYSASEIAREEFPDLDVSERGAVSIARRLQDPLAELVKIDPQAVGVGLYQHDVDQTELAGAVDRVVESAVTFAGVDVNTASAALLGRVAGLNRKVAGAVVLHREAHGKFRSRQELLKVPGVGPRTFQQAAGFLKVPDGQDLLDRTFIHPESYAACRALLELLPPARDGESMPARAARLGAEVGAHSGLRASLAADLGIGEPTLADMLENLAKPGLDPRTTLPPPLLRSAVLALNELREGMILQGTVRNVVDFGAFVDIGLKHDGLVHVSELSDRFVQSPLEVVSVGQVVSVRVLKVERERGRIALSMRAVRS